MITNRILKHRLGGGTNVNTITMPVGTQIMHFEVVRGGYFAMWALTPNHCGPVEERTFEICATGEDVPNTHHYHGTVVEDTWVWHLFEHNPLGRNI